MTKALSSRQARALILTLLILSGAAGLIYEVVWMKMLSLVLGNTVIAVTTVLTAFMGGLSLGSLLAGRFDGKLEYPLRAYGILEAIVGAYALLLPALLGGVEHLFRFVYQTFPSAPYLSSLLRFLICGSLLLVPTTLMGATLPILCRHFAGQRVAAGRAVAALYGWNTLGAGLGSLSAGFVLIPHLGLRRTVFLAVALNLTIAAAVLLSRRIGVLTEEQQPDVRPEPVVPGEGPSRLTVAVLLGVGLSGVAAMVYQVAWTRALVLSIGSSVYAFSLILTAFICGLALGSLILPGFLERGTDRTPQLATVIGAIGISGLSTVVVLDTLPVWVARTAALAGLSFEMLQLAEFAAVFLLLLVPTSLMGAALPIATAIIVEDAPRLGRFFGNVYSANTAGAIVGSVVAGFVLIPRLGTRNAILSAVTINLITAGIVLLPRAPSVSRRTRVARSSIALVVLVLAWSVVPAWDPLILTSGPYVYGDLYRDLSGKLGLAVSAAMKEGRQLLFLEEGQSAVVSVKQTAQGDLALEINGKTDATAKGDAGTQLMAGHLPLLLHPRPERVLVIGLGTGMTLGATEQHPVKEIDVVELEPAVVRASALFTEFTGNTLDDPRVDLRLGDGRSHLALTGRSYDVIISEPTNIWISGVASLFTSEFFAEARRHLRSGGLICQWVQAYSMSSADFESVVRTFLTAFPQAGLWEADLGNDYLLVGSVEGRRIDLDELDRRLGALPLRDRVRMNAPDGLSLVARQLLRNEALDRYTENAPVNTDDNGLLEYSTPRALVRGRSTGLLEELYRHRSTPESIAASLDVADRAGVEQALRDVFSERTEVAAGFVHYASGAQGEALASLRRALGSRPGDYDAAYLLARLYSELGKQADEGGRSGEAGNAYRSCIGVIEEFTGGDRGSLADSYDLAVLHAEAELHLGVGYLDAGSLQEAERAFRASLSGGVRLAQAHNNLGVVHERLGAYEDALQDYRLALEVNPDHLSARMNLGNIYLRQGNYRGAIESYRRVQEAKPSDVVAHYNLGVAYFRQEQWEQAEGEWSRALELDPGLSEARDGLAAVREKTGRP